MRELAVASPSPNPKWRKVIIRASDMCEIKAFRRALLCAGHFRWVAKLGVVGVLFADEENIPAFRSVSFIGRMNSLSSDALVLGNAAWLDGQVVTVDRDTKRT